MKMASNVSIVIPAYNEQDQLAACLEAIARQSIEPLEVIVVDNNSTDGSAAIARRFDFVKVVKEPEQGVAYARDRGFNEALGEIIGRIDADTILEPDWVATVLRIFEDRTVTSASGRLAYRHVGLKRVFDGVDWRIRNFLTRHMSRIGEQFLYGGNMAIRAETWRAVRGQVCHVRHYHEDLDLAIHLNQLGKRAVFAPEMSVSIAPRQANASPRNFWKYLWSFPKIYVDHRMRSQRFIYPIVALLLILYPAMRLMYRGYDSKLKRFSLFYAITTAEKPRISPLAEPAA